jgi:uncharacterized membrane protein
MFLSILGIVVGLLFFLVGFRLAAYPRKFIKGMMNYKYKTSVEPQKGAVIVTIIMGAILMLGGLYYIVIGVVSIINPA